MASNQHKPVTPVLKEPVPRRPRNLLQRLSSGIVHVLPPFRKSTPQTEPDSRPTTAPNATLGDSKRESILANSEQRLVAQLETSSEPERPCPYDSDPCHPFTSIEKRRCSFCGMRGPKIVQNEPCHGCKTGDAGSHISSGRNTGHRRHSAVDGRHLAHLVKSTSSVSLAPRPVTPKRAAKRIGNPPRVSRLPAGVIRLPAANTLQTHYSRTTNTSPSSRLGTTSPSGRPHDRYTRSVCGSSRENVEKKPASPKLHHIHGLPKSDNFPYVHNYEIPKHAAALCAGSTSPLTNRSNSPRSPSSAHGSPDYSSTVYYGDKTSPSSTTRTATPKPCVTTVLVEHEKASGSAVLDIHTMPLDTTLGSSRVYRKHSPKGPSEQIAPFKSTLAFVDSTDSGTTFGSQDTGSTRIGDIRLELKGGDSFNDGTPRLRGGSGYKRSSTNTFSFKLKRWLLTCHAPCPDDFDTDSDADLPPARVVSPERVARARESMNRRASIPTHLKKGAHAGRTSNTCLSGTEGLPVPTTFTTTIEGPPQRSPSFRLSSLSLPVFSHRQPKSHINQPASTVLPHPLTSPFPQLRGGAESPNKVPPTLFWLAGGKGKPISFSSWKESRPKQRMGGLFGMAVYGSKYGRAYGDEVNKEGEVESSCTASIKVTANGVASMRPTKSSTSASSSSSSSAARDVRADVEGATPVDGEPVQRAATPPPISAEDEVHACSGALPVESK